MLAPRLEDPQLPRIADLEAYESRNVPPEARKPFLEWVAAIHRNRRIANRILPEIDGWIGARGPAAAASVYVRPNQATRPAPLP